MAGEVLVLAAIPVCVFLGVEAVYASAVPRPPPVAEQGRYIFPAAVSLSAAATVACFAFGRRWAPVLGTVFAVALILIKAPAPTLIAVGMYLPFETTGAIFVGGCLKWIADKLAARRGIAGDNFDNFGSLVASGLIAGESLTGVLFAGAVLAFEKFSSITHLLFGVDELAWVEGPAGAWASLAALGVIVWLLVVLPLRKVRAATA